MILEINENNTVAKINPVPLVSVAISTLGRSKEILTVLNSLSVQTNKNFEIIIIDQNDDDRLSFIDDTIFPVEIRRISSSAFKGVNKGRNTGWKLAKGEIVLFADDDCWYPPNFIEKALSLFETFSCDILSGRATDASGNDINGRFEKKQQQINKNNVWTTQIEWMVFFRKATLQALGGYDESMGLGSTSPWQASEGQEIMLRALSSGFMCVYDPTLVGHHAVFGTDLTEAQTLKKTRHYARGMGYVLRKNRSSLFEKVYWLARPIGGMVSYYATNRFKSRYYLQSLIGRFEGLIGITLDIVK